MRVQSLFSHLCFYSRFLCSGMDVCALIENVKTDESDKPLEEIRIHNVDLEE